MCYGIFLHKSFKRSTAEMSVTITNYRTRGSEVWEIVLFQELYKLSFVLLGMASTHLDT